MEGNIKLLKTGTEKLKIKCSNWAVTPFCEDIELFLKMFQCDKDKTIFPNDTNATVIRVQAHHEIVIKVRFVEYSVNCIGKVKRGRFVVTVSLSRYPNGNPLKIKPTSLNST